MLILLIVGLGLLIFGAFVLLKFPDRPGGKIAIGSAEVSSVGAGLPLIFLGVICVIFYGRNPSLNFWPFHQRNGNDNHEHVAGCFADFFGGMGKEYISTLEVGAGDLDLIGSHLPKDQTFGILFTENRQSVGAIRVNFFSENELFKIESVVDATCQPVEEFSNSSRGGDKHTLQNWDTVEMQIGDNTYALRLGYDAGIIGVNYFRKIVQ